MRSFLRLLLILTLATLTGSCNQVGFRGFQASTDSANPGSPPTTTTTTATDSYFWFQAGFGACSKPCGGGTAVQDVSCRRSSDNVTVADSFCNSTRPDSTQICNAQACTSTYTWNAGPYGSCSKTCGGGSQTRTVVCQDHSGNTVADTSCDATTRPVGSTVCNVNPCSGPTTYSWVVTPGLCSKDCGGGTQTDVVVCQKNDGSVVDNSNCDPTTQPPASHSCNTQACPVTYTYTWLPGIWSPCSVTCGPGIQTRSLSCQRNDGAFVGINLCPQGSIPASQQACNMGACPTGRKVTQTTLVPPASNQLDVILIVDDSSSMSADQTKLATRMSGFISNLDALNIDYQVCLSTTDIGYYQGSPILWQGTNSVVMNKATANKNQVFVNTINSLGAEWSNDEQGIKQTYLMIRDYRQSGCFRDGATLTVIELSDEDERSVGGNQSESPVQYQPLTFENYPDNLIKFVHQTFDTPSFIKPFIWNSIITKPGDAACLAQQDAQSSPGFPGVLLADLANKTGGHVGSICDSDYTQNLVYIKNKVVNSMPGITMQCVPIDVPQVTFDKPVTTSISIVGNQIKFTPALPEGVTVTATYTCPN